MVVKGHLVLVKGEMEPCNLGNAACHDENGRRWEHLKGTGGGSFDTHAR